MRTLVFATNNKHKLHEVSEILHNKVLIKSLSDMGLEGDIPETADTLQGNALQKAQWVWDRTHTDCFADDTGLEVEALGGAPGVYSARYAGEHCSFDDNINKLLAALDGCTNRRACFRTVICLMENGVPRYFEGRVDGVILTERYGSDGFGSEAKLGLEAEKLGNESHGQVIILYAPTLPRPLAYASPNDEEGR